MRNDRHARSPRFAPRRRRPGAHRVVWSLGAVWLALVCSSTALAAPLTQDVAGPNVLAVVLPLLAASVALERVIEVIWNYIDWLLLNSGAWQPADLKSSQYVQFKSGTSLVLAMVLGVLISNYTGMRLFDFLRPLTPKFLDQVPSLWDVLITGFVLGASSKPIHDILGIITQTKNLLANSAIKQREGAAAAMAEGVLKLAQSDAQATIDVPGVGPARLVMPGSAARATAEGEEGEPEGPSVTDQYIDTLRKRASF